MADQQSKSIEEYITVRLMSYPAPGELVLSGDRLCAIVGLTLRNESVFSINIQATDVSGHFSLNNRLLAEPAGLLIDESRGEIVNLQPLKHHEVILTQALRQSDAEEIQRCLSKGNGSISISSVDIFVTVQNFALSVTPKPLRLSQISAIPLKEFYRSSD